MTETPSRNRVALHTAMTLGRTLAVAILAGVLVTACGGGDEPASPVASPRPTTAADGASDVQAPIAVQPAKGCDTAPAGETVQPPLLNTQLDCAP